MRSFPLLSVLLFALGLIACGKSYVYESETEIPNGVWGYRDTIDFKFEIKDTAALYNLYVDFDHADSYPSQNVYVKLYTRFPDGMRLSKVVSFDFFNAAGKPNGKCSGQDCSIDMLLQSNAFFNQAGEYVLTLEQYTRTEQLEGVKSVGFRLEKLDKKK